ncbi:hypothetical protein [Glutamicibacter sp. PS]|uniref:hypothetical protein n=1 Tax=Glutamicibacter sp. PS TaxID=3075634 RepID=UPI002850AB9C|nr:hypothetical protein [Glutamicibacter sp. PS]MDR4534428.1 hypothetical protein [Glutamicibacter sp. PS]
MTTSTTTARRGRRLLATGSILALGLSLTACGASDFLKKQTADAWSVTYEVTVEGKDINRLTEVSYLDAPSRGESSSNVPVGEAATTNSASNAAKASWTKDAMVTAEADARISATPGKGAKATCRILLDGERELAKKTGAPGKPVECSATTPAFETKKKK